MDIDKTKRKIRETEELLKTMKRKVYPYRDFYEEEYNISGNEEKVANFLDNKKEELEDSLPPGFELDHSRLRRHLHFNEMKDWADMYNNDLPNELRALGDYKEKINYLDIARELHPQIDHLVEKLLEGEISETLNLAFRSIEIRLRKALEWKEEEPNSTCDLVKKAFSNEFNLIRCNRSNVSQGAVRDFIAGVIGVYRNFFTHNEIDNLEGIAKFRYSVRKLILASETHALLDECEINKEGEWKSMESFESFIRSLAEQE